MVVHSGLRPLCTTISNVRGAAGAEDALETSGMTHISNSGAHLREQAINALLQPRGMRADQAACWLAIDVEHEGGHTLNALLARGPRILVDIHARETQATRVALAQFLINRRQRVTRRTPGRRKINDDWQLRL